MSIRTLLIGVDGATFSVLDPLMKQGAMPFLASFLRAGARADLATIVPALTPPAWTSLMTGRSPGQHGVFDFFRMESPETRHLRFFTSHDVQCDTIWDLAAREGLPVTSLNYPAMFPPPRIPGYIVPGWIPWRQLRLACWPEDLFERLKQIPGFNPRELAMDIKLEERATEGCSNRDEYAPWIELHIRREQNWLEVLKHLAGTDPSPLTAVLFDGVDKLQHLCWRFIRPEDDRPLESDWEHEVRKLCLAYFRNLDDILRQLCEQAGPAATVVIASDHGFGPTREVFYLNAWLEKMGYLAWANAGHDNSDGSLLGVGKVARHTFLIDWSKTTAFAATPTSNGIYIVVNRDGGSPGIEPSRYEAFRSKLMAELAEVRSPFTGERVVARTWTREEAFAGPHGAAAPDLTLALQDGGLISILASEEVLNQRPVLSGAHRPLGVFAARGPGIRPGVDGGTLSILDVAPLVLYSLGLGIPESMEGAVPESIFERPFFARRPPRKTARLEHPPPQSTPVAARMSTEDEGVVLERLRELGYID